jgi:phytoene dehydrogenase-like protein
VDYDCVVVGGGHNGLVAACYLARAGLRVGVFERRTVLGGCCTTEELLPYAPGFKVNGGAIDHILIQRTPIIRDLGLESYGLRYVSLEPMFEVPFDDGKNLAFYSSLEKTAEEFAKFSVKDSTNYLRLARQWLKEESLLEALMLDAPPKISELLGVRGLGRALFRSSMLSALPDAAAIDFNSMVRTIVISANQLLNEEFEDEHVKVGLSAIFSLIFSTMSPSLPSSGLMAIMHTMLYRTGLKRPLGGSGKLVEALAGYLKSHGGEILLGAEVRKILVNHGSVVGVELADGSRVDAKIVVSNVDAQRTLTKLVEPGVVPEDLQRKLRSLRITSYGMTFHAALHTLPRMVMPNGGSTRSPSSGKLLALDTIEDIEHAYHQANSTRALSPKPLLAVNFPTTYDPSLAPMDKHVVYCWAQFVPDDSPMIWEKDYHTFKEDAYRKIVERLESYWPDLGGLMIDSVVETPGDLEQRIWIPRGNTQHIDPTLEQMYYYRPTPELSHYRTPIRGLYITGAGTHPGGGISGMPGYNTAKTILRDLQH